MNVAAGIAVSFAASSWVLMTKVSGGSGSISLVLFSEVRGVGWTLLLKVGGDLFSLDNLNRKVESIVQVSIEKRRSRSRCPQVVQLLDRFDTNDANKGSTGDVDGCGLERVERHGCSCALLS